MWSLKKTNTRMRTIITSCCPRGTAVIPPFPLESYLILACPLKDVLSDPLPAPYTIMVPLLLLLLSAVRCLKRGA